MRKMDILTGMLTLLALLAAATRPAHAQKKKKGTPVFNVDANGEPKGFREGESMRYAIWHGKHGWHLRTTTAKREHQFVGAIHIEGGTFEKPHSFHLEKEGKLQDQWKLSADRTAILFDFKTDRGIAGLNFHVSPSAKFIRFHLHIDGKHHADRIFVGHGGHHPPADPFLLVAHPNAKKEGCGEEEE